jgi:hypothetical protein
MTAYAHVYMNKVMGMRLVQVCEVVSSCNLNTEQSERQQQQFNTQQDHGDSITDSTKA